MNRTKIEWCNYTWNPVTGCLHGCNYCYARRIVTRFSTNEYECRNCTGCPDCSGKVMGVCPDFREYQKSNIVHELYEKAFTYYPTKKYNPYPYGFEPTLHLYRMDDIQKNYPPADVFVCSMSDLFGAWIPEEWKEIVFRKCNEVNQLNFLFLTKAPGGIPEDSFIYSGAHEQHNRNLWFGTTINTQRDLEERLIDLKRVKGNRFISIEPIQESINLEAVADDVKWIITGAESGNRKDRIYPEKEWIEHLANQCSRLNIPLFMKDSLENIWEGDLLRQKPTGLTQYKGK